MSDFRKRNITFITGGKGAGKSLLIGQIVDEIRKNGLNIGGLHSPGIYKGDKKIGISVKNLRSCETKQLARYNPGWDPKMLIREWEFDEEAVLWGNDILANQALPCDVLIVDEIGYLELEKTLGWVSIFDILKRNDYSCAYIVVCESLLGLALQNWEGARIVRISEIDKVSEFVKKEIDRIFSKIKVDRQLSQKLW